MHWACIGLAVTAVSAPFSTSSISAMVLWMLIPILMLLSFHYGSKYLLLRAEQIG